MDAVSKILGGMGADFELTADTFEIILETTLSSIPIIEACRDDITGFEVVKGTMDDAFIAITGKEIRE